jgi:hypothetical protein
MRDDACIFIRQLNIWRFVLSPKPRLDGVESVAYPDVKLPKTAATMPDVRP